MDKADRLFFSPLFIRLFIPYAAGYFISVLLGSANAIMSSILVETFSLSASDLGFMTSVYLISFGLAQLPLGVLLDRCGARKTVAPFLLLAAAGAVTFAASRTMAHLVISRALLGIGLSGCLMSAFKAYAEWLPAKRLPLIYSMQCLAGGLGGMAATKPMLAAFEALGWRSCFILLAIATSLVSAAVWFITPRDEIGVIRDKSPFFKQFFKMLLYLKDPRFCMIAPAVTVAQGVMFAYLYLWVGPWMRDVALMSEEGAGFYMMLAFAGAAAGYFLNGLLADLCVRRGWMSCERLYLYSSLLLAVTLGFIAFDNSGASAILWAAVMFFANMTMIAYPMMRGLYGSDEVGRVLSLLNFTVFLMSFVMQWCVGEVLNLWPAADGHFSAAGHRLSLFVITASVFAAATHLYICLRKNGR